MKNAVISLLLMILMLALAACGNAADLSSGERSTGETSLSMQLAIGTLLLEETEFAVTPEQAAELLPLWQILETLSVSGSAADVEIDSLYNQIQEVLSVNQIEHIASMEMGSENMTALLEPLGLSMRTGDRAADENGDEFTPPDGEIMQGGGPGGEMSAEMQALSDAERQTLKEEGMGDRTGSTSNPLLIAAVVQLLTEKVTQ